MEDVVISGMSGRLPQSDSIEEFAQKLYDGVDLVTEDDSRWPPGFQGLPRRLGKLKNLSSFDAGFFSMPPQQANRMDIQLRKVLEVTYETLIDAGINPEDIRGSRTGVYVGANSSDCEELWNQDSEKIVGYTQIGCCCAMFSNRISYVFDFKGPSMTINTACSSSMVALVQAVRAVRTGVCDAALIAGMSLHLRPNSSICFDQLGFLSSSGKCAAFDESASGFVKSEAVVSILIQRRSDARRIYATIRGASISTDGHNTQGITYPSGATQSELIESTYKDAKLKPEDVAFVEAHGTGTQAGDFEEVTSIAETICKNRSNPLLVGSLKSNIGHTEVASGICAIIKVLLAMERNVIPSNLHYLTPNPKIPALIDGRVKVVNKNTEWTGGLVSVNSFGFGGVNAHVILEGGVASRSLPTEYVLPRLIVASGRTEDAVTSLLDLAAENSKNADLHALLDAIHYKNIPKHMHRGYQLLTATANREIFKWNGETRPVWFVFSGFNRHWSGTYRQLFRIPEFNQTLDICAEALKPYDVDLHYLLREAPQSETNAFTSFLSVTAIQIALVNFLRSMEIYPDGIIGHSLGEIGCAYGDGALTAEQAILSAYWRVKCVLDSEISGGAMAIVGLTWDDCAKRCPPDVQIVCHNAKDNVTISGPQSSVQKFVAELSSGNILAKHFDTDGVAYHSKYISSAAPLMLERLKKVILHPKPRSQKWISTSTQKQCNACDAAYFVNNFLSPVRFEEAMREVPDNAILIEIAPVALLRNIIQRQKPNALYIPLLSSDKSDSLEHLLSAVGRMYGAGAQPQLKSLYPARPLPVSRGTPGLSSRILWDHSVEFDVPKFENSLRSKESIVYDLSKRDDSFLAGHNIDGQVLFPGTGYLVLVWRTMAKLHNSTIEETPIIFENVRFKRPIVLSTSGPVEFTVTVLKNSGEFEVSEGDGAIVTGHVRLAESRLDDKASSNSLLNENLLSLSTDDIYKELRVRGYYYSGIFCGIKSCNIETSSGTLVWNNNWVTFLDTMLQFKIIGTETKQLYVITSLQRVYIDPKAHLKALSTGNILPLVFREDIEAISSPGVEFHGMKARAIPRLTNLQQEPVTENYNFYPYDNSKLDTPLTKQNALSVMMQTIIENLEYARNVTMVEFVYESHPDIILQELSSVLHNLTQHRFDLSLAVDDKLNLCIDSLDFQNAKVISTKNLMHANKYQIAITKNILTQALNENYFKTITFALSDSGLILLQEPIGTYEIDGVRDFIEKFKLILVSKQRTVDSDLLLFRRKPTVDTDSTVIEINDDSYDWIEPLREALKKANNNRRVYAISRSTTSGIIGFGKALRTEPIGRALRIFFLPNAKEIFSLKSSFYFDQIRKDLYTNVLQGETWGSYNHFIVPNITSQSVQTDSAYVNILNRGDLSSLTWVENNFHIPSNEECYVHYASLNFHDIMLATGKLYEESNNKDHADQECPIGLEYSGVMSDGRRVMGMVPCRGVATTVRVTNFLWEVPKHWTLEEAATVPMAYGTAYFALTVRGRMRRGETVLVHAGSGGVGQAAIAIALHAGCTVLTTVGTPVKRAFLLNRFPALCPDNIGNSRDTSFEQLVRRRTCGRGVDLVLNSLAGDQLMASVRCLAHGGRFLEIGRFDITEDTNLGMSMFLNNTTFHGIMLKDLFDTDVVRCVEEGLASGAVMPLSRDVFHTHQVEQAFRHMAAGKHIGKVLIRVREEDEAPTVIAAVPQPRIHPDKFYVLIGGCGGFGLELAHWLVSRGVRHLLLHTPRAARTGYQTWNIQRLRSRGAQVIVDTRDCTSEVATRSLLQEVAEIAPIAAIFNLALVLKDGGFEKQTPETFDMVWRPKFDVTYALDKASRLLAPDLDYFVVFSSVSCGRGNYGQSNYAYANSAIERLVESRRRDNLPGLAIQWGIIGDVGAALNLLKRDSVAIGTSAQSITSCLNTLAKLLTLTGPVVTSWVPPLKQVVTVTRKDIGPVISNILGVNHTVKNSRTTFEQLGMDSLISAEIKRTLERQYNIVLEIKEIHSLTFEKLEEMVSGPKKVCRTLDVPACGERELVPKHIVVRLPSIEASSAVRPVFMVHPIEGVASPFLDMAANICAPVYGLQCADVPTTSFTDLASCYVKKMRDIADPPYTLLGYSYGGAIAFEMAYQLEQAGCEVRLICVDGSPKYIKAIINTEKLSERSYGSACHGHTLAYFTLIVRKSEATKVARCIRGVYNWEERLDAVVDLLKYKIPFPVNEIKMAANKFRDLIKIIEEYDANKRLKGHITLFTASQNYVQVNDDYGLRDMCSSLNRRQLQATHQDIITGERGRVIADFVNKMLQ